MNPSLDNSKQHRINVQNLGCKVNRYESDAVLSSFIEAGYAPVNDDEIADVYVVNTCGVTSEAARKSRQFARRVRRQNPEAIVVAMGCQVQLEYDETQDSDNLPDLLIGQVGKSEVPQQVQRLLDERLGKTLMPLETTGDATDSAKMDEPFQYEDLGINSTQSESRAYIKVQDGCSYQCSYCTIPRARGRSRSRGAEQILKEAKALAKAGYKEAVITGVEVASYGKEKDFVGIPGGSGNPLLELLERLDAESGLKRIRLSSLEPAWVTEDTAERLAQLETLGHHFHLSLQSGSDRILRLMRRRYTTKMYREAVRLLRAKMVDAEFTTDVIVGFPGETEEDHAESLAFCEEMGFMRLHVFRFSPRPRTDAALMGDRIHGDIMKERSAEMQALSDRQWWSKAEALQGSSEEVLIESIREDWADGYTRNYWPISIDMRSTSGEVKIQDIVPVRLELPNKKNKHVSLPTEVRLIGVPL